VTPRERRDYTVGCKIQAVVSVSEDEQKELLECPQSEESKTSVQAIGRGSGCAASSYDTCAIWAGTGSGPAGGKRPWAATRRAWRRINWRRFFDINDLVAIRPDRTEVFDAAHALVLDLYAQGLIDGLRIDHVDGLLDPGGYCRRSRSVAA